MASVEENWHTSGDSDIATYSSDHQPEISSRLYSYYDYKFMLGVTRKHVD